MASEKSDTEAQLDLGPVQELLVERGFRPIGPSFIKDEAPIRYVVEPQRAVYAPRVTLNIGLELTTLTSGLPWAEGRHASRVPKLQRWIRLGKVTPAREDLWWTVVPNDPSVLHDMARKLRDYGLPWLEREGAPEALLAFAEARRNRSRSEQSPHGTFDDLRLCIAVHCWRRHVSEARRLLGHAAEAWAVERARLEHARDDFGRSQDLVLPPEPVPDLLRQLEALIEATDPTDS